jgi:hypothetical protein
MSEATTGQVLAVGREVENVKRLVAQVGLQVESVSQQQQHTDTRLQSLAQLFDDYVRKDRLDKELQLAETRIVKIRQDLENRYGHYADVRRRATGILQALDVGVVTHETIQSTTEDVMLAATGYWLAPTLVALAAWGRDDRILAEKAVQEALGRDLNKTTLFFSLVLRRFGRHGTSSRWLSHFFDRQDPRALTRDLVVLIDAVATGAFGLEARALIGNNIEDWLGTLESGTDFPAEQRQRWQKAIVALTPQIGADEYRALRANCLGWTQLEVSLAAVRRNAPVRNHFEAIFEGELPVPREIEQHIDGLLTSLVSEFDPEELPLRREESFLQAVIDTGGDKDQATHRFDVEQEALVETVDFMTLLTNAAMHADQAGASRGTQRLAVALSRDWVIDAYDQLVAATRSSAPDSIEITLDGWKTTVRDGVDEAALASDLDAHIQGKTDAAIAAVKFKGLPLAAAIGVVPSLALIAASPALGLVCAVICAVIAYVGYARLEPRRKALREAGEREKHDKQEALRLTLSEWVDYAGEWKQCDANAEPTRQMLSAISVADHRLGRDDEARMVIQ